MNCLKKPTLFILFMILVCCSCKEEDISFAYPRVRTHAITDISPEGAVFHGELMLPAGQEVAENGFVWQEGNEPLLESSEKKVMEKPVSKGRFSASISTTLKPDTKYFVKAYAKTKDHLVYGQVQSFVSLGSKAPVINSIEPENGIWGDTVRIKGSNFSYRKENNTIRFGSIAAEVINATDSLLTTTVPLVQNGAKVNVSVEIAGYITSGNQEFHYLIPTIASFSPTKGTFLDTIIISGSNLDRSQSFEIKFNTALAKPVAASSTTIKVQVPLSLRGYYARISLVSLVSDYKYTTDQSFSLLAPVLSSFSPDTVTSPDQVISINGTYFNPVAENNTVKIGGYNAPILQASATNLQVQLPDELTSRSDVSVLYAVEIIVLVGGKKETFSDELIICW